jgi:hypothetical protein
MSLVKANGKQRSNVRPGTANHSSCTLAKDVPLLVSGDSIDEGAYGCAVFPRRNMVRLQEHRLARTFALLSRLGGVRRRLQAALIRPLICRFLLARLRSSKAPRPAHDSSMIIKDGPARTRTISGKTTNRDLEYLGHHSQNPIRSLLNL